MSAGEVLQQVPGLTRDKLSYYVRMGYVKPKKVRHGELYYNEFSEEDVKLIRHAFYYISEYEMKVRKAFERAEREIKQGSFLDFFIEKPSPERSLKLILLEPRSGGVLKAKVGDEIQVTAQVAVKNMTDDCNLSIDYEQNLLRISERPAIIKLGSGTFVKDISRTLTVLPHNLELQQIETMVTLKAVAGEFSQIAQFKVIISEV